MIFFFKIFSIHIKSQNNFNFTKIFLLRLFKIATNQTECSKHEQRFVINILVAKRCKPYEIYRICDMYEETCFSQNSLYKWINHGFTAYKPESKRHSMEWKHIDSLIKKKIYKVVHVDRLLASERTHHY